MNLKSVFVFILILFISSSLRSQTLSVPDSLKQKLTGLSETEQASTLIVNSTSYLPAKSNLARFICNEALTKLEQTEKEHPKLVAKANYVIGESYYYESDFKSARPYYEKACNMFQAVGDTSLCAETKNCIGLTYYYTGEFNKAIQQFIDAYNLYTNLHQKSDMADMLSNIAMIQKETGDNKKAMENYLEALSVEEELGDSASIAVISNGVGLLNYDRDSLDLAFTYLNRAKLLFHRLGQESREASVLHNLGMVFQKKDEYQRSLPYLRRAKELFEKEGDIMGEAYVLHGMGAAMAKLKMYGQAEKDYLDALTLAQKHNLPLLIRDTYENLYEFHNDRKDYRKALKYHVMYTQLKDSLFNKEKADQLAKIQTQYETEKNVREVQNLKLENELKESRLKRNILENKIAYGLAGTFLIILIILLNRFLENRQANRLLESKNREIEQQNKAVEKLNDAYRRMNDELRTLNSEKDTFFSIIAHDLKNPFHALLGLSFLLKEDYQKLTDNERVSFAGEINHTSIKIFQMLENLLAWARTQTNQIEYNPDYINLNNFAEEIYENTITQADLKDISLSFEIRKQHQVYADALMLETILKNLITNAIKFTPKGGAVRLRSELEPDSHFLKISVFDNGIGLTQKEQAKLFRIDQHLRKTGTEKEEGSGLGLLVCQEFIKKHGGEIGVNSEPGKGSHFWITLPVSENASQM